MHQNDWTLTADSFKPVWSCINICPKELDSAVKDPHLDDSLYSATCK